MGQGAVPPGKENGVLHGSDGAGITTQENGFLANDALGQKPPSLREWKSQAEKAYVRQVWDMCAEDVRKASEVAGISRGHWYELMKKTACNKVFRRAEPKRVKKTRQRARDACVRK